MIQIGKVSSADTIAALVNLSKPSIYKIVEGYNKSGVASIKYSPRGGRHHCLLNTDEEAALLQAIEQKAAKGLIKTANDIRLLVENRVGKKVSDDYLWDLFKRNGWKKKMPRPHHPKKALAERLICNLRYDSSALTFSNSFSFDLFSAIRKRSTTCSIVPNNHTRQNVSILGTILNPMKSPLGRSFIKRDIPAPSVNRGGGKLLLCAKRTLSGSGAVKNNISKKLSTQSIESFFVEK